MAPRIPPASSSERGAHKLACRRMGRWGSGVGSQPPLSRQRRHGHSAPLRRCSANSVLHDFHTDVFLDDWAGAISARGKTATKSDAACWSYNGTSVSPDNRRGNSWRNDQAEAASGRSRRRTTSNRASFHCEGTAGPSWPPRSAGSKLLAIALCSQLIKMTPVRSATAAASSRSSPFAKSVFGSICNRSAIGTMVWCGRRLGSGARSWTMGLAA